MPGPSPGGSPERDAGAGNQPQGPGRDRRVRFLLPHITIPLPSVRDEEQLFYQRLEALVALGPGSFGPLFAADGWSDLTEDRLLRKRVVQDGQGGPRPGPGQMVLVKVLGALEDGGLVERDPLLSFVPGHGDVVQALELGVPTMQPGEVSFFLAAFPYGYGRPGSDAAGGAGRPRGAAAPTRHPPVPGLATQGKGQLPLRAGRLRGSAGLIPPGPACPRRPRYRPTGARGGRGAAGAACQVLQQLRGRGAEAGEGGRGAGVLRGGPPHQPGQRPGAAPSGAAAGATGPRRGGSCRSEESPGARPGEQGDPRRAFTAAEPTEPLRPRRPFGAPLWLNAATFSEPRGPSTARSGRRGVTGPAAPGAHSDEHPRRGWKRRWTEKTARLVGSPWRPVGIG
ncbi:collagen alpha-1(I) chain-like isoform X1 [Melanerpes formicivorus]|uniref:collagen alpha-1(I) chain-like isoform X1 n=1 Tax=Melanerpes formicivorus TaxID=211600 RepID=UPI00358DDFB3